MRLYEEEVRLNLNSIKHLLPIRLGGNAENIWINFFYERPAQKFYEKYAPYNVSVDIGAGVGFHTKRLARLSKRVIAIEPVNDLTDMPENVEVHKVAVGRRNETRRINFLSGPDAATGLINAGFHGNGITKYHQKLVKIIPLDKIVTKADFLKIDVEGYELEVLEPSSIIKSINYAGIELHDVDNLVDYQTRILNLLKDFRVYAIEINQYVTVNNVPLPSRKRLGRTLKSNTNNHRLLCKRVRK